MSQPGTGQEQFQNKKWFALQNNNSNNSNNNKGR